MADLQTHQTGEKGERGQGSNTPTKVSVGHIRVSLLIIQYNLKRSSKKKQQRTLVQTT